MVVGFVGFEVLGQFPNAFCEKSNLDLGGSGIFFALSVLLQDFSFAFGCDRLSSFLPYFT